MKLDGKIACAFSSGGGWVGGMELACQSILTLLLNFGFLVFGVTDYATKLTTLHYDGAQVPGLGGCQMQQAVPLCVTEASREATVLSQRGASHGLTLPRAGPY